MKLSESIKLLETLKSQYGDIELCLNDAETDWIFKLKPEHFEFYETSDIARIEISVDYYDETLLP